MQAKKLKTAVVEILQGDITSMKTDVIVNFTDTSLRMKTGVGAALKAKGGVEIEAQALQKAPAAAGSVFETGAGNLFPRYIIHTAVMGGSFKAAEDNIKTGVRNALQLAEKLKMETAAFPAPGGGMPGFLPERSAEILFEEIMMFDNSGPVHVKRIYSVLFAKRVFDVFYDRFRKIK
ncbi:MAG: macro domain-containing protein [Candidatus Goldiibacteriota bacterium]